MYLTAFTMDLGLTPDGPQIYEFGAYQRSSSEAYRVLKERSIHDDIKALAEEVGVRQEPVNARTLFDRAIGDKGVSALYLQPFIPEVMAHTIGIAPIGEGDAVMPPARAAMLAREFPQQRIVVKSQRGTLGAEVFPATTRDFAQACGQIEPHLRLARGYEYEAVRRVVVQPLVTPQAIEAQGDTYVPTVRVWCAAWMDQDGALQHHYFTAFYKLPHVPAGGGDALDRKAIVSATSEPFLDRELDAETAARLFDELDMKFWPGFERFLSAPDSVLESRAKAWPHEKGFVDDQIARLGSLKKWPRSVIF